MPSLPTKISRRRKVTPVAEIHGNDAWQRTFDLLGLVPLTASSSASRAKMDAAEMVSAPASAPEQPSKARKLTILDLPAETQKEIFKHASSTDLIALSLVSKHFRDIAAAQLYRNFHIVFPDDDDLSYESPIDGLAGGLDTFVTSEYDYSRYLREIVLDTLSGGSKGERAYRHYTYDVSCGKFMNTLFLLTLRKAKALETFKWDLRVELSRPVYKALHQIKSLQHLHLRMHAGPSIYEAPPPLPSLVGSSSEDSNIITTTTTTITSTSLAPPPPPGHSLSSSYYFTKQKIAAKAKAKSLPIIIAKEPPTISGFKGLKSLAVLDMDTLEYVAEIKECIKSSSATLHKLKLSFSESLARQARKPPPADDPDESDQDIDEFGNMIPPPPPPALLSTSEDAAGPAKAFRAQEEKKSQEAVLGRMFDLEPSTTDKPDGTSSTTIDVDDVDKAEEEHENAGKTFIKDLTSLSKKLMTAVNTPGSFTQQQKDALEIIEQAARKYVEASKQEATQKTEKQAVDDGSSDGSITAKATPVSSVASVTGKADDEKTDGKLKDAEKDEKGPSLFADVKEKKDRKPAHSVDDGLQPDDIDVYAPEADADNKDFEDAAGPEEISKDDAEQSEAEPPNAPESEDLAADAAKLKETPQKEKSTQEDEYTDLKAELKSLMDEAAKMGIVDIDDLDGAVTELHNDLDAVEKKAAEAGMKDEEIAPHLRLNDGHGLDDAQSHSETEKVSKPTEELAATVQLEEVKSLMHQYLRNTRGIPLRTLAVYLIPIKASVLAKAIDLNVLKRITLLNVGPQIPFWNLLAKENKVMPLPLRKIHTDNVTVPFLTFVSQMEELAELFMLERTSKCAEYSFAPKTTVTIDQIRKLVLKKHAATLKKLVIKNENDYSWDANEQVIKLLCKKAKLLEELGISFGVRAVHIFNQYLPGLTSLRAMHIISFRNDDTCHWVTREIRKFAVDSVSHNPEMKLEYIALESNVERLVRRSPKSKQKGKGKAGEKGKNKSSSTPFPTLETLLLPPEVETSDEDSQTSDDEFGPGLRLETLENVRFYDVYGIRMWRKDILLGRI